MLTLVKCRLMLFSEPPAASNIRFDEQQKNTFEQPPLWIDAKVDPCFGAFCKGDHCISHHVVVKDLLASGITAVRFVRQSLASDRFVHKLHVFQLVFELGDV